MNEWTGMNEWMNEWLNKWTGMNEWMHDMTWNEMNEHCRVNEWMHVCMLVWKNKVMNA